MKFFNFNKKGFTLIDTAILLFVLGIFTAATMKMIHNNTRTEKIIEQQQAMDALINDFVGAMSTGQISPKDYIDVFNSNYTDSWGTEFFVFGNSELLELDVPFSCNFVKTLEYSAITCPNGWCTSAQTISSDIAFSLHSNGPNKQKSVTPHNETTVKGQAFTINFEDMDGFGKDDIFRYITYTDFYDALGCNIQDSIASLKFITQGDITLSIDNSSLIDNNTTFPFYVAIDGGSDNLTWYYSHVTYSYSEDDGSLPASPISDFYLTLPDDSEVETQANTNNSESVISDIDAGDKNVPFSLSLGSGRFGSDTNPFVKFRLTVYDGETGASISQFFRVNIVNNII